MAPYARKTFESAQKEQEVGAARSASWLAVCHVSCWAASVILGVVSVWLRLQATMGIEQSIVGIVGVGFWGTLPYIFSAILSIRAAKLKSYSSVRVFFISSILSLICSTGILAFSSVGVAIDAHFETVPKRVIVAGILATISLLEVITSILSCVGCYTSIGCFNTKTGKGERINDGGLHRTARIAPSDDESGHVTVMALPARQAAELFYTMYRPFFQNSGANGMNVLDSTLPMQEQFFADGFDVDVSGDHRRRRRRRTPRPDTREYDSGYANDHSPYVEGDCSEDEAEVHRGPYPKGKRQARQFQDDEGVPNENTANGKSVKLAPVFEYEQTPGMKTDPTDERSVSNPQESKPSKEKGTISKDQRHSKGGGGKQTGTSKDNEETQPL